MTRKTPQPNYVKPLRQAVLSLCKTERVKNPATYFYVLVIGDETGNISGASGGGRLLPLDRCRNLNGKDMVLGIIDCLSRHIQSMGGPALKIVAVPTDLPPPDKKVV